MKASYIPPDDSSDNPLEQFTTNLTALAKDNKLDPVIGRDNEIRRIIQILSRRTKNNPVLLGDPGVGKTAIIEGLAQRIVAGDVPDSLRAKQLLSLDLASLLAGASFRGQFEERLKSVIKAITDSDGGYIIFIDELHTIMGAGGGEGSVDASNMLKPPLARGALHAIGATTTREYRQYIERDPAFERRFQPIYVDEPDIDSTVAILRGIKEKYETHHGIKIADEALVSAVTLSKRYIADRFLPDKAIDLVDEAAAGVKIELDSMPNAVDEIKRKLIQLDIELAALKKEKGIDEKRQELDNKRFELNNTMNQLQGRWEKQKNILNQLNNKRSQLDKLKTKLEVAERNALLEEAAELKYSKIPNIEKEIIEIEKQWQQIPEEVRLLKEQVTGQDIARVVSRWTGIPIQKLVETEAEKLTHLEDALEQRVVGQDEAIIKLSRAIRRSRVGLGAENRPIGSFLFLGPTGVGKTETAKALSETLFDSEKQMIRIDMSEYQEAHTVARLLGAPPGYVGHDEGGQLTEAVRRKPYSVILVDEIEKAHSAIFNIFLQILDDGRLTDARGRTVDFKNTIIIMTSNIGSEFYSQKLKKEERDDKIMSHVRQVFKPEFINRLDGIVLFNEMNTLMMEKIVQIQLNDVIKRLKLHSLEVSFTGSLKKHLQSAGFDPVYGARPLKRLIDEEIIDEIASLLLEQKTLPHDRVTVDYKKNRVIIESKKVN